MERERRVALTTPKLLYLLDTNILSEPIKDFSNSRVSERVLSGLPQIATAATVWNELLFGYLRLPDSRRRRDLGRYLFQQIAPEITVLSYDRPAAEWHASERVRLGSIGLTPPFEDGQIAAVAYVNGLTLVTANVRHFRNFQGLQIEDWSR